MNINNSKKWRIAIIGATGMVGRELIQILEERSNLVSSLSLFSSKRSAGEKIDFAGEEIVVNELCDPEQIDANIAFFAVEAKVSQSMIRKVAERGCICIDKSSAFRLQDDVSLIVPEVNGHLLHGDRKSKIIASPNCVVAPLVQVLAPLDQRFGLEQVMISTYQAVSGAGQKACDELEAQVRDLFNLREFKMEVFNKRISFNVLPFISSSNAVDSLGKTDEESKIIEETKKILGLKDLMIDVTCVRVPVFNGHSMAVSIATKKPIKTNEAIDILAKAPGIILIDNPQKGSYPTSIDACGEDLTLVGRVRPNTSAKNGLNFWISSDNLRTGAALNAMRIAETIMLEH